MFKILQDVKRALGASAGAEAAPTAFVTQALEPTGGKILRPSEWFYREFHRGQNFNWTISREEPAEGRAYTTGVRIQMFINVEAGTGKTARPFVLDLAADRTKKAAKVIRTCDETDQGLFTRTCLETEEGPYRVLYSLFWGSSGMDVAVVVIAGTRKPLWETYASTFDTMSAFDLIDMSRFEP